MGVLLLIFREVIRKNIFPTLTNQNAYRTIRLLLLLTFTIAAFGIGAWVYVSSMASTAIVKPTAGSAGSDSSKQNETQTTTALLNETLRPIYFSERSTDLTEAQKRQLTEYAQTLGKISFNKIVVEGHTDAREAMSNVSFSQMRASIVLDFLANEGIPREKMQAVGFGAEQPLKTGSSSYNERVVIRVIQ